MAMRIQTDSFTESGGAAALSAGSRSYGFGATTLGVKGELPLSATIPLVLKSTLGRRHVFGDVTPNADLAFASAPGTPFTVEGAPIARDSLVTEAGIVWNISANATAGLFYSGDIGGGTYDNVIKGKLEIAF